MIFTRHYKAIFLQCLVLQYHGLLTTIIGIWNFSICHGYVLPSSYRRNKSKSSSNYNNKNNKYNNMNIGISTLLTPSSSVRCSSSSSFSALFFFRGIRNQQSSKSSSSPFHASTDVGTADITNNNQDDNKNNNNNNNNIIIQPTNHDEKMFIQKSLLQNPSFAKLPETSIRALMEHFERMECLRQQQSQQLQQQSITTTSTSTSTVIIKQGDSCENDYVYMVGPKPSDECIVLVDGNIVPDPFGTVTSGTIFGDMAVLYNEPRAATVMTKPINNKQSSSLSSLSPTTNTANNTNNNNNENYNQNTAVLPSTILYRIKADVFKNILHQKKTMSSSISKSFNDTSSSSLSTTLRTITIDNSEEEQQQQYYEDYNNNYVSLETMQQIDEVINEIAGSTTLYSGNIIPPYKPERIWLWKQWKSTILNVSYKITLLNMALCWLFVIFAGQYIAATTAATTTATATTAASATSFWNKVLSSTLMGGPSVLPDPSLPFVQRLSLIHRIWQYQQGLTTFILTFFLNQAFSFWNSVYGIARSIQGRFNDFHLLLSTNVERIQQQQQQFNNPMPNNNDNNDNDNNNVSSSNSGGGTTTTTTTPTTTTVLTQRSRQFLEDIGRYSRLHHVLLWASTAKRFSLLITPAGLERMASRGLMTKTELEVLQRLDIPTNRLSDAPLQWMMIRTNQAIQEGILNASKSSSSNGSNNNNKNDNFAATGAIQQHLLDQMMKIRGCFGSIGDKLSGRMPLAYAHFVQILVDTYVWTAPFALYSSLGKYSIFCVGILTLFYTGLLNLAKIFLDPLNNESFCNNSIFMDLGVLIRESNGGSIRWKNSVSEVPF